MNTEDLAGASQPFSDMHCAPAESEVGLSEKVVHTSQLPQVTPSMKPRHSLPAKLDLNKDVTHQDDQRSSLSFHPDVNSSILPASGIIPSTNSDSTHRLTVRAKRALEKYSPFPQTSN